MVIVAADGATDPVVLSPAEEELDLSREYEAPRWSQDGETLYCLSRQGIWEFARDGSQRRLIPAFPDHDLLCWLQPPMASTLWMPKPHHLLAFVRDPRTKETGLVLLHLDQEESTLLITLPMRAHQVPWAMEASTNGSKAYVVLEGSDRPAAIWHVFDDDRHAAPLYRLNPQGEGMRLGTSRLLDYQTLDGEPRQAVLLLPADYREGQRVPVVVEVYGGSVQSNALHVFGISDMVLHGHLLASQGYAVLYPDLPFKERDPLRQLPGLVLPAVHRLIDLGIADPKRIGLMGQSYGGYCTLALLTQTSLFAAAVACSGFADLVGTYLSMRENGSDNWLGWCESGQGRMGGPLWEKRESYIENSPIFYLDRVQTPLLLVCGSEDGIAPAQAQAAFVGLRRLGKEVELRQYQGQGHWSGTWSEQSYRDLADCVLSWFAHHPKA